MQGPADAERIGGMPQVLLQMLMRIRLTDGDASVIWCETVWLLFRKRGFPLIRIGKAAHPEAGDGLFKGR
jgi:hypothetical protein